MDVCVGVGEGVSVVRVEQLVTEWSRDPRQWLSMKYDFTLNPDPKTII
ncbi:MAG: hypothetical protein WCD81_10735 [Candidatus Bathyarchaeia archaeon]